MNFWWVIRITGALLARPSLWWIAVRQAHRFANRGWWRRAPFLPLPERSLAEFRSVTQYGDPSRVPDIDDVLTWLAWAKDMEQGWPDPFKRTYGSDY